MSQIFIISKFLKLQIIELISTTIFILAIVGTYGLLNAIDILKSVFKHTH